MPIKRIENYYAAFLLVAIVVIEILLGLSPQSDRATWAMENLPIWILLPIIIHFQRKVKFSKLALSIFFIHAVVLAVGGYYSYAKVPFGFYLQDLFHFSRNPYDRIGHLFQGFGPAFLIWEFISRRNILKPSGFLCLVVFSMCMAFSAIYELLEWCAALVLNQGAEAFLGTQGDIWDTQWDLFCCLIGATLAITFLYIRDSKLKSKSMQNY